MLQHRIDSFQFSPIWPLLSQTDKAELVAELSGQAQLNGEEVIVPSPAAIAVGLKATS